MWGRKKELGIIVRVELKNDKGEQAATHIQALSLDFPMPPCSVIVRKGTISPIQGLPL